MELKELIKKCKKNDRSAQSELFSRYKDTLYFMSLKYSRNDVEAEDNLHDSFITIFETISKYRGEGSFEGWMKRIAIFKAIDKYKAKKPVAIEINDDLLQDTEVEDELTQLPLDTILKLIQELPDQYRLVFNLHQLDGYKHREIAQILEISENTSKSNYHRAKLILREKIMAMTTPKSKIKNS
ncbi:RNA polymerase sigma factor [Constantimarinum furrinae]|uniref:RNA polymerase sigma factor, sigma-70 family n=1 Tax=Constantimarinum furrinae TaxID=2562285 RepID=A0A7G8PRE9_9FLAO|nr:RNA polymerase sigma factor [Constantimarinum furrinae]QNJ96915.1 RNA polymerase sigma factor, sigma-70 family [Constantimarinum furrinae]